MGLRATVGKGRATARVARSAMAVLLVACAAAVIASQAPRVSAAQAPPAPAASCRHVSGPFHTVGDQVLNPAGVRYIPYGINIVGLAHPLTSSTVKYNDRQIHAAATFWCVNTVRLQISEDQLVRANGTIHKPFLAAVEQEVAYARSLGVLVALNLDSQAPKEYMPTAKSERFWGLMASLYRGDPGVIFDLFNEPRNVLSWTFWRDGGTRDGVQYFGMQQLASFVRSKGAQNLLWIEGPHTGGSLRQAWDYRLRGVSPLMYDIHRPPEPNDVRSWQTSFGYLAYEHLAPVLDGEWADYARTNAWWACWDNAPVSVPIWLHYLREHQIGLIVTKLVRDELLQSQNFDNPTRFKANWSCKTGLDEGAGTLVMQWFERQNGPTLYAAASPRGAGDCFRSEDACSLKTAMREAQAGDTIELVTSGNEKRSATWYRGGFRIATAGTSAGSPVTIEPARGVTDPILDGGKAHTVLKVGDMYLDLTGVTIQNGKGTVGGGIANRSGGTIVVTRSTFSSNTASSDGGAIDNGDHAGTGALTVTRSTFSSNTAGSDGGAIDNGDNGGKATLTVTSSTFSSNTAGSDGGAIDNGDNGGDGTLVVTASTFSARSAGHRGSVIESGNHDGTGVATAGADIFDGSCARVSGTWRDKGYNVASHSSCLDGGTGDRTSLRAGFLGELSDNGGGILTMLPLTGNPAIGSVPYRTKGLCPTVDERGRASKAGAPCVSGAVQGSGEVPRPVVSSVSPRSGPVTGGTRITITGSHFLPGAKVLIGQGDGAEKNALRATKVDVVSPHRITATTSGIAKRGKTWDLYVVDAGKTSAVTAGSHFKYAGPHPAVTSLTPASGPAAGGTTITITGRNFIRGAKVLIGHRGGPGAFRATKVHVVSSNEITALTPAGATGTWNIYVADAGGMSATNRAVRFAYTK